MSEEIKARSKELGRGCCICGAEIGFARYTRGSNTCGQICYQRQRRGTKLDAKEKCQHCGNAFTPKRSDAKYCSARCRVSAKRQRDTLVNAATTPTQKPQGGTKENTSPYVYCRTYGGEAQPSEVRRYVIRKELKTVVHLQPGYSLRCDGKWHRVDGEALTLGKWSGSRKAAVVLSHELGDFQFDLPRWWREGKPEPSKAEPDKAANDDPQSDPFADLLQTLERLKPDWAAFGFTCKPSEAAFKKAHRKQSLRLHPDRGGDARQFASMQAKAERCLSCYGNEC